MGWGEVLDDLLDADVAGWGLAFAGPDVLAGLGEGRLGGLDADDVDAVGVERSACAGEVREHLPIGHQVADGVDGAEGNVGGGVEAEAGHVADDELKMLAGAGVQECCTGAGIGDHVVGEVQAGGCVPFAGEVEEEASGAGGGFEEVDGFGGEGAGEVCAGEGKEGVGFIGGAGGVEDVVDEWVGVEVVAVCGMHWGGVGKKFYSRGPESPEGESLRGRGSRGVEAEWQSG